MEGEEPENTPDEHDALFDSLADDESLDAGFNDDDSEGLNESEESDDADLDDSKIAVEAEKTVSDDTRIPEPQAADNLPPVYTAEHYQVLDTNYQAKLDEIIESYDTGELSNAEFERNKANLLKDYFEAKAFIDTSIRDAEQARKAVESDWQATQDGFFAENADFKDPLVHAALSAALTTLYQNPSSAKKSQATLLNEASVMVSNRFGIALKGGNSEAQALQAKRKNSMAAHVSVPSKNTAVPSKESGMKIIEKAFFE